MIKLQVTTEQHNLISIALLAYASDHEKDAAEMSGLAVNGFTAGLGKNKFKAIADNATSRAKQARALADDMMNLGVKEHE